jgi:hypothetical protein
MVVEVHGNPALIQCCKPLLQTAVPSRPIHLIWPVRKRRKTVEENKSGMRPKVAVETEMHNPKKATV